MKPLDFSPDMTVEEREAAQVKFDALANTARECLHEEFDFWLAHHDSRELYKRFEPEIRKLINDEPEYPLGQLIGYAVKH